MKRRKVIIFIATGLVVGTLTAGLGYRFPVVLEVGVGLLFFAAILAAIALTDSWPQLKSGTWRYLMAAGVSTAAYVVALIVFSGVAGYSPQMFGVTASRDIGDFGTDVWIGLLAASIVAALFFELLLCILTGRWSNNALAALSIAGCASIPAASILRALSLGLIRNPTPAQGYWAFFGSLFPVGEALVCGVVGSQIWETPGSQQQIVH